VKLTKSPTDPATKPHAPVSLPDQQSVLVLVHLQHPPSGIPANARIQGWRGAFAGTTLDDRLEDLGARTLYVTGLATDTYVQHRVLEACKRGFRVVVVEDGVRGMNVEPGDADQALAAMREAGAVVAYSAALGVQV